MITAEQKILRLKAQLKTVETDVSTKADTEDVDAAIAEIDLSSKQDVLVSGTNIKTINSSSLLGSGDLVVGGGSFSGDMDDIPDGAVYVKTHNDYTDAEQTKLAGIETGAEVNNISDANATDLTDAGTTTLHNHDSRYYTETEIDGKLPSVIHSTGNSYSWVVSNTQYISIVVTGVLVIDGSSVGAIDCSIQLQHGGAGVLTSITAGFRNSDSGGDRIPFTLTYVATGTGWDGNDFSVVEVTYGSTIEEVNWNFNYRV